MGIRGGLARWILLGEEQGIMGWKWTGLRGGSGKLAFCSDPREGKSVVEMDGKH